MKRHTLICLIATLLVAVLCVAAAPSLARSSAATGSTKPAELLQFSSGGHVLGFEPGAMIAATGSHALRVEFVNANAVTPQSAAASEKAAMPLTSVTYPSLWDGVTLTYDASGIARSTYRLEPYADVSTIRLRYNRPVQVQAGGWLQIAFETGAMHESAPVAWQEIEGQRIAVEVAFSALSSTEIGFVLGVYDPARPLVIDPTLTWNTFLGSGGTDQGFGIAVDGLGNVYVTGVGVAWGTPVNAPGGGTDAFAAKLDNTGARQWHTFLGGGAADQGRAITVDTSGNVYLAGNSSATWGTPVNPYTAGQDAFAAKLNSSGVRLWHTFLGSGVTDTGSGIAVDASGNIYVAGTSSASWGTPVNPYVASSDAFAAKLDSSGVRLWHTFLGGSLSDTGSGIAVDASGNVYVVGDSNASWGTPVNPHTAGQDAFAAKLDGTGVRQWHTFLGGGSFDQGQAIAVDSLGNVYVAGSSSAGWGTPVNPYQFSSDGFAARLDSTGVRQWHTFLGSGAADQCHAIAVDSLGNVYLAGLSFASWGTPINPYTAGQDAFAAKLNSTGVRQWHTFLGSGGTDQGHAIAVDASGNVYVAGESTTTWGSPVNAHAGATDAFAAKISDVIPSTPTPSFTATPTDTPTDTPTPSSTPTDTPTEIATPTETATPTNTPADTPSPTPTPTDIPTNTPTPSNTPTSTPTNTPTPSNTPTSTPTDTPTDTPIDTPTSTPINQAPTISIINNQTTNEDTSTGAIAFTVGDVETTAASLTLVASSTNTTLVPNTNITFGGSGGSRTVTVVPAANQYGTTLIKIVVSDGALLTSSSFVLTVTAVNDAPVPDAQLVTTNEDTSTSITLSAIDVDSDTLFFLIGGASHGTLSGSGANQIYTPNANYNGPDSFTFIVNDGTAFSNKATVSITVTPVNDAPTISIINNQTTNEDTSTGAITFTVGDVETAADSLTLLAFTANTDTLVPIANISFGGSGANRTVTAVPAANQFGAIFIKIVVSDGALLTSSGFVLTVTAVNDNPIVVNDTATVRKNVSVTITVLTNDSDVDGDTLAITSVSNGTKGGTISRNINGTITFKPKNGFTGTDTFTYTISDGQGGTATGTVTVSVTK